MLVSIRRRAVSLGVAILVLATVACAGSSGTPPAANNKPFVVGAVLPFSGIYGTVGSPAQQGIQAAINQVNASGGFLGRQATLVVRDDQSDPSKSVLAARDLIDNQKVDLLIPEAAGPLTLAILPVSTQAKMPTLEPGTGDTNHPDKYPYNFGWQQPKAVDVAAIGAAIKTLPSVKGVGIVSTNDIPGLTFAQQVQAQMPGLGYKVAGTEIFAAGTADLTVQLQRLKGAGPEVLAVHATGKDITTITSAIRDLGWTTVSLFGDGGSFPLGADLNKLVPPQVQAQVFFPSFRGSSRAGDTADSPFIAELQKIGPVQSLYVSALEADAIKMMRWAYNRAGSTDPDKVKAALEGVGKLGAKDLPQDLVLYIGMNPGFSATDHSIGSADLSKAYALCKISPLVNGTYQQVTLLTVPKLG